MHKTVFFFLFVLAFAAFGAAQNAAGRYFMKYYRIGEFAKKLGVTPDFLKYCEKNGLLSPSTTEKGYRSYDFTQSARIIEYLKLKNQGYSSQEINSFLKSTSFSEGIELLVKKEEDTRLQIRYLEEICRYHRSLQEKQHLFRKGAWRLLDEEGYYFLPHTREHDFLPNPAIPELVSRWTPYLPIVMSAYQVQLTPLGTLVTTRGANLWGFLVKETFAREVNLPVTAPVLYIPPSACLEIYSVTNLDRSNAEASASEADAVNRLLLQTGMKATGNAYVKIIAKLTEQGIRTCYSTVMIPV